MNKTLTILLPYFKNSCKLEKCINLRLTNHWFLYLAVFRDWLNIHLSRTLADKLRMHFTWSFLKRFMRAKSKLHWHSSDFLHFPLGITLNYFVAVVLRFVDTYSHGYPSNVAFGYITLPRVRYKSNDQSMITTFPDRKACNHAFYMQHTFKQPACKLALFYVSSSTCLYK